VYGAPCAYREVNSAASRYAIQEGKISPGFVSPLACIKSAEVASPLSRWGRRFLARLDYFAPNTQREYIHAVKRLAAFLGRSLDVATPEELRTFQLHLTETGVRPPTLNGSVTALRFFFKATLDLLETTRHLVFVYEPRKLPCACAARGGPAAPRGGTWAQAQGRSALPTAVGLRALEVALKADIDSNSSEQECEIGASPGGDGEGVGAHTV